MPGLDLSAARAALKQCTTNQGIAQWWQQHHQLLLHSQAPAHQLAKQHSILLDALLETLLAGTTLPSPSTVLALGAYGQKQLLPYAPISLLLLGDFSATTQAQLQQLLHHIEPRFQCRIFNLQEWHQLCTEDLSLYTHMLDARLVAGSKNYWQEAQQQLPHWPAAVFFAALEVKHLTDQLFTTSPNLRRIAGGLQHLDTLRWLACNSAQHALTVAPLTAAQQQHLRQQQQLLLQTGWHLQCYTRSHSLLFTARAHNTVVNAFNQQLLSAPLTAPMLLQRLYIHALHTAQACRIMWQRYREQLTKPGVALRLINRRFMLRQHYLETTSEEVIERWPFAMVEMFVIQSEEANVERFSSRILSRCVAHKTALQAPSPAQQYWLLRLLGRSQHLFQQLLFMHQLGLLAQQIPELDSVTGAIINEPGQLYPRDLHALATLRELQQLRQRDQRHQQALPYHISYNLPKPALLYIAGLFHKLMPTPARSIA